GEIMRHVKQHVPEELWDQIIEEPVTEPLQDDLTEIAGRKMDKMLKGVEKRWNTRAEFVDAHTVRLIPVTGTHSPNLGNGEDTCATELVTADKIFIGVGTAPFVPDCPGLREIKHGRLLTNEEIFHVEPKFRVAVLCGGVISMELSEALCSLGCEVTIIHRSPNLRVGNGVPKHVSDMIEAKLVEKGVRVIHPCTMEGWTQHPETHALTCTLASGEIIDCDYVLSACGRRPVNDTLNLSAAGVTTNAKGFIEVDKYLRTKTKNIFAPGDSNGHYLLSHAAMHQ
ncbi:hypothetical protein KIPB_013002, partial [Kipferlia bialata]